MLRILVNYFAITIVVLKKLIIFVYIKQFNNWNI